MYCAVLVFCYVCCDVSSHGLQAKSVRLRGGSVSPPAHIRALLMCAEKARTLDVQILTRVQAGRIEQDEGISTIAQGVAAGIPRACCLAST
jgi:hypothetical protein